MTLPQQLEEKKKERLEIRCSECGIDTPCNNCNDILIKIDEIIAILEQAIAEKKKQRQEILDKMQEIVDSEKKRCGEANAYTCWHHLKKYLEQLNQAKTEQWYVS